MGGGKRWAIPQRVPFHATIPEASEKACLPKAPAPMADSPAFLCRVLADVSSRGFLPCKRKEGFLLSKPWGNHGGRPWFARGLVGLEQALVITTNCTGLTGCGRRRGLTRRYGCRGLTRRD